MKRNLIEMFFISVKFAFADYNDRWSDAGRYAGLEEIAFQAISTPFPATFK